MSAPAGKTIRLKLENLQPIGSFKVRPIANAVLSRNRAELDAGIYTTSSGNSALGVAWMARRLGVGATAVVPANAPEAKLEKLRRLGARIEVLANDVWWRAIEAGTLEEQEGIVHRRRAGPRLVGRRRNDRASRFSNSGPTSRRSSCPLAAAALPAGIACAVRALRPEVKIIACELASAHPLQSAFDAGGPTPTAHNAGFVSGVGYG